MSALGTPSALAPTPAPPHTAALEPAPVDPRAAPTSVGTADGVDLATDVYLPADVAGALHTVLIRLPYDKCGRYTFVPAIAGHLTAHGFAVVAQDVRGKFRSTGRREPFVHEAADGAATLDWIVAQPWSSGAVGMYGDSYYGFTQWAAASTGHPALRAIVPRVTGSTFFDEFGATKVPKIPFYEWAVHTFTAPGLLEDPVFSTDPQHPVVPAEHAGLQDVLDALVRGVADGSLFERSYGARDVAAGLGVPALHMGGWFDNLQRHQLDDWQAALTAPAAEHQYLRMDSSDHEDFRLHEDGAPHEDHEADDDVLRVYLERTLAEPIDFLRHYLSGRPGRWEAPRVRHHVAGAGWQVADRWPPLDTAALDLHLAALADALSSADGGLLDPEPVRSEETATWTHDPERPVPWLGTAEWAQCADLPDESLLHDRADVATFTTSARDRAYDVVGAVGLDLTVTAPGPGTHVIARLLDVYPSGRARLVLEGAVLASGTGPVHVRLGDTGYRVRPGHRLRLAVSSSLFPLYAVHPGTDAELWAPRRVAAQPQTLTSSPAAPAVLHLPVRGW